MKKYKFSTKLLSSLVHTEEVNSNIANIYREKVFGKSAVYAIPALHGNSIRGLMRNLGAKHLLKSIEVKRNTVPLNVFHILFSGGALEKSEQSVNLEMKKEVRSRMPFLSILGSAMGDQMLQGKLIVSSALPQCKELGTGKESYHDMVSIVRYTRQDDIKAVLGDDYAQQGEEQKQQMFYDIEVLSKGVVLDWEVILDSDDELEVSCLETILQELSTKPYLGGASRVGHGKVDFSFDCKNDTYKKYLESNAEKLREFILRGFKS